MGELMTGKLAVIIFLLTAGIAQAAVTTGSMPVIFYFQGPNDTAQVGYYITPLGDINHDGYDDIAISCAYPYGINIFLGGDPPSAYAQRFLDGIANVFNPVDMDGDGIPDLIARRSGNLLYIYKGFQDSIASVPNDSIIAIDNAGSFSVTTKIHQMGPDLGTGFLTTCTGTGCPTLRYYTLAHLHSGQSDWSYTFPDYGHDLGYFDFIDFNGDGYQDICMGAPADLDSNGYVYIFFGPDFKAQPDKVIGKPSDIVLDWRGDFAYVLGNVGDFNGDGWDDLAVQYVRGSPKFLIYNCGPGADTLADYRLGKEGDAIAGVGDINGDGYNDLAIGGSGSFEGMIFAYLGGKPPDTIFDAVTTDNDIPSSSPFDIGWRISSAGDFNGDGYEDIMFSSKNLLHDQPGSVTIIGGSNQIISDVEYHEFPTLPTKASVKQNYPNPFNPSTTIEFFLPREAIANIEIYNILGQKIAVPFNNKSLPPGMHSINWNGCDQEGRPCAAGIYLYKLTSGNFSEVKKMMLLK